MLCALTNNGRVSSLKLALFGAPPPQATQTLPCLSLCRHACAGTVCASDDFPLPLLSLSTLQVRVRGARRPASEAAATVAAATTPAAAAEARMCRGGGCCACARAADGGGDRRRRCRRRDSSSSSSSSVVSGQWSVCVRSRRARDARVTREWHPRNTTRRCAALRCAALRGRRSALGARRSAVDGRGRRRRRRRGVWTAGRRRPGALVALACGVLVVKCAI